MSRLILAFIGGICTGVLLVMVYLHRNVIKAAITGGEMPKPPKSCPAYTPDEDEA